jgi:hypothetical protein
VGVSIYFNKPTFSTPQNQNFTADQQPQFSLARVARAEVREASLIKNGRELAVEPVISTTPSGEVSIQVPPIRSFTPGKYQLSVSLDRGRGVEVLTQDFSWGVLAFNVYSQPHRVGDEVVMAMAVLDDLGVTLCDAVVILEVKKPNGEVVSPNVTTSDICADKFVTDIPDYQAKLKAEDPGTYEVQLRAQTKNGERSLRDQFEVVAEAAPQITRETSMRIYPVAEYRVALNVTGVSGKQVIKELVPNKFTISGTRGEVKQLDDQLQEITWEVDVPEGGSSQVAYTYNAPDITPQFYLLGPAQVGDQKEKRSWQIASDEVGSASSNRIWSSGAELNSLTAGMEITSSSGTTPTIDGTTKRSGDYAYRTNTSSNTATIYKTFAASAQSDAYWVRAYIRIATAPGTEMGFLRLGTGTNNKIGVRMNTDRSIELWNEEDTVQIGSASSVLATDTWYRVELFVDTTTLSSTDATLKLDGVDVASSTSQNLAAGLDRLTWGNLTSTTANLYFDDIALNGDTGRSDNWPGEGKIVHMHGNADGDNEAWTAAPSNTDDFDDINEVTPSDGTGGGMYSGTSGQITDMDLESSSSAGITAGDTIKLVSVGARMNVCGVTTFGWSGIPPDCTASEADINYRTRIKATSGGTVEDSGNIGILDSYVPWFTNDDDGLELSKLTLYDQPGTSVSPWTTSTLDTAQIGLNNQNTGIGFKSTALWLLVEYNPASGGRLYSSGFELNSTTADMEWTSFTAGSIQTSVKNGGTYAYASGTGGAQSFASQTFAAANSNGPFFARGYVYVGEATTQESSIMELRDSGGTRRAYITIRNSRELRLYDEDGQIGSDSSVLTLNTWYRIELKINTTPSSGSHEVEGRIDGSSFASSSTRSISTGVAQLVVGNNIANAGPTVQGYNYWDDVAINQNVGTVQNSWPGPGLIFHLSPDAAGDNSAWTNTHTSIDDTTPPNDATDVISETTTNDIFDTNLSASSLGSEVVNLVSVGVRFRTNTATEEQFRLRLKDASNGVTIESPILAPASTTWRTHTTASPFLPTLTAYTRPEQDTAWTDTQLDTAQVGVKDMAGSGTVEVTSIWLLVEYQPVTLITVSGTIYSDEGVTVYNCSADNLTIGVSVNGGTSSTGTCTAAGGTYTVTVAANPSAVGEPIAVWIDSAETPKATTVTRAGSTSSNITGFDLYQNRLIVRHEDSGPITNANLATADNTNAGIRYAVSSGNLTIESGISALVWTADTFTPGGTVTTNTTGGDFKIGSSATFSPGSNAVSIGGSWNNSGTFTAGTSTVTFTAVATGRTLSGTLDGTSGRFHNLTFNGVGGGWTLNATTLVNNDLTITNGTVSGGSSNLTVTRHMTLADTSGVSYTFGSTTVTVGGDFSDAGGRGSYGTSTVNLNGTGTMTTVVAGAFYNLTIAATGMTTQTGSGVIRVTNIFTVDGGTVNTTGGYIELRRTTSGTPMVVNGTPTFNGTKGLYFTPIAGSVTLTYPAGNIGTWNLICYTAIGNNSTCQTGGALTAGELSFEAENGLTGSTFTTTASNHSLTVARFSIAPCGPTRNGSWTVNLNDSSVTLNTTGNSIALGANCGSHSINLGTSDVTVNGSVVLVNGTSTISLTPGTSDFRFAPANGATRTFTTNNQSLHNAFIQAAGATGTVLLNGAMDVNNNLTITTGILDVASGSNHAVTIGGNYSNSGTFEARAGTVTFDATTTGRTLSGTLTYGNGDFNNITFNGVGGEWSINSTMGVANAFTVTNGTVIGSNDITVSGNVEGAGTINLSGGTFEHNGGGPRNFGTTSGSANWTFSNLTFSNNGGSGITFTTQTGGSGTVTVAGILRVGKSGNTFGTTLNAGNRTWILSGTGGDPFQLLASPNASLNAATSTFRYTGNNGSGNTNVQGGIYQNLEVDNAAETYVLEAYINIQNDLTVTNGGLTTNNFLVEISRDLTLANNSGVALTAGTSTIRVGRNFTDTGAKYVRGTSFLYLNGTGTLNAGGTSFHDLSIAVAGQTTSLSSQFFSVYGTLYFTGGTVNSTYSGASNWINLYRSTSGSSIVFTGPKTTFIGDATNRRVLIYRSSGPTGLTLTITGADYGNWGMTLRGDVNNITWSMSGVVSATGGVYFESNNGVTGSVFNTNSHDINTGFFSFGANALSRNGSWTVNLGNSNVNFSVTTTSLFVNTDSGTHTINLEASKIFSAANITLAAGTGAISLTPGTSTVTFAPPTSTTKLFTPNGQSLYNLVVDGAGTVQLEGAIDVDNDLRITAGTLDTKSGSNFGITVGGNWTNNATFTPRSGTVTFNDASKTSTLTGTTTFFNLSSTTPLKALRFTSATTFTINGLLTLTGSVGNPISIAPTTSGSQWNINHQGTENVTYTTVTDSGCAGGSTSITLNTTNTNGGNNGTCWLFSFVISGTVYDTDGVTPVTTGPTVRVKVNGAGSFSAIANGSGVYTINDVPLLNNDHVISYLDTGGGIRGETVTKVFAGSVTLNVYRNRTTFQCDTGPGCILYPNEASDYDATDDADIYFDIDGGSETLTVPAASTFSLRGGFEFSNGTLTFMDIQGNMEILAGGRFTNTDSTLTISGNYSNAGEYISSNELVVFNATTTGKTISGTLTGDTGKMNSVEFNGSGGAWAYSNAAEVGSIFLTNGTLNAPSTTLTVTQGMTRTSGTFTHNSGKVIFANGTSGGSITGNFTGTSAFHKVEVETSGVSQDVEWFFMGSTEFAAANATDTLVLKGGTTSLGEDDASSATHLVRGQVQIATGQGETARLSLRRRNQGLTNILDVNANTSTPSCSNCTIEVGSTGLEGSASLALYENTILRLNPRSSATASDAGVRVYNTGQFYMQGTQDDVGTVTATDTLPLRETKICVNNVYTSGAHTDKMVRMTSGLALGRLYPITATTVNDTDCVTNSHDSLTRANTASSTETSPTVSGSGSTRVLTLTTQSGIVTSDGEHVGRYVHNLVDDTYYRIISSDNVGVGTDTLTVVASPDSLSGLATNEDIEISDGVRSGDGFEVIDHAHVTAEAGTACNATVNQSGEAYMYFDAGAFANIVNADICNLGRNGDARSGLEVENLNSANFDEGITISKSRFTGNFTNFRFVNVTSNGGSEGIKNSYFGAEDASSTGSTISGGSLNEITDNFFDGVVFTIGSSFGNTISGNTFSNSKEVSLDGAYGTISTGNTVACDTPLLRGFGLYTNSNLTLSSNTVMGCSEGIYLNVGTTSTKVLSNTMYGNTTGVRIEEAVANLIQSNTIYGGTDGVYSTSEGSNTYRLNTLHSLTNGVRIDGEPTPIFAANSIYGNTNGIKFETVFVEKGMRLTSLSDTFGSPTINSGGDVTATGATDLMFQGIATTLASTSPFTGFAAGSGNGALIFHRDTSTSVNQIYGDYNLPTDDPNTASVNESILNVADTQPMWGDRTFPVQISAGDASGSMGSLQTGFSTTSAGSVNGYSYQLVCGVTNCSTTTGGWDVYRNGVLLTAKASTSVQYTDTQTDGGFSPNVTFTIPASGSGSYGKGYSAQFTARKGSTEASGNKTLTVMSEGTVTIPANTTLNLSGVTETPGSLLAPTTNTTAYNIVNNGTIRGDYHTIRVSGDFTGIGGVILGSDGEILMRAASAATRSFGSTSGSLPWQIGKLNLRNATAIAGTATYNLATGGTGLLDIVQIQIGDAGDTQPTVLSNATNNRNMKVAGSFSVVSNGTYTASATTPLLIEGAWNVSGTGVFNANGGVVSFGGTSPSTVSGTTTFANLTISSPVAKTMNFSTTGIVQVTGQFTAQALIGQRHILQSTSSGVQWNFQPTGTYSIDNIRVKDGGCEAGSITMTVSNSEDMGNNDSCWVFNDTTGEANRATSGTIRGGSGTVRVR